MSRFKDWLQGVAVPLLKHVAAPIFATWFLVSSLGFKPVHWFSNTREFETIAGAIWIEGIATFIIVFATTHFLCALYGLWVRHQDQNKCREKSRNPPIST